MSVICFVFGHKIRNVIDNSGWSSDYHYYQSITPPICLRCGKTFNEVKSR